MAVKVDPNKCIGCGACVAICPAVFEMGSNGKSKVKNASGECDLESAKSSCPVGAISL
jgi:ferredoxin